MCKECWCAIFISPSRVYTLERFKYTLCLTTFLYSYIFIARQERETGRGVEYSSLHDVNTEGEQNNITNDCHSIATVGPNTCRGGDFANLFDQMERNKQSLSNHVEECIEADSLSSFSSSSILRPCFLKYLYLWT